MSATPAAFPAKKLLIGVGGAAGILTAPSAILWMRTVLQIPEIRVILTKQATRMMSKSAFALAAHSKPVTKWSDIPAHKAVPHIALGAWADVFLIYPATANLLAKAAHGLADDILTTTILAAACPVVFVPTMNTIMWRKSAVQRNVKLLREDGSFVIEPVEGLALSSEDSAIGSFPHVPDMMKQVAELIVCIDHINEVGKRV